MRLLKFFYMVSEVDYILIVAAGAACGRNQGLIRVFVMLVQPRAAAMLEARAEPRLRSIQGLWGNGCKGTRGGVKKPGRMTDFIVEEGLLPAAEVQRIRQRVPLQLVQNQEAFAHGEYAPDWPEFFCQVNDSADAA